MKRIIFKFPFSILAIIFVTPISPDKQYNSAPSETKLTITYLGTAGWEITDGQTTILIDPYLSRIQRGEPDSSNSPEETVKNSRRIFSDDDFAESDTAVINQHIRKADYILAHHSHRDHIMDIPFIARKTGAVVIGTETTANIMSAYGISEMKIITVKGGEDYDFGTFSLKVIPSLHSPLDEKRHFDSRQIPKGVKAPLRLSEFVEGGSLNFLIRFNKHEIFTSGSMNYIENELRGLHPDVAIVGAAPSRHEIYNYAGRLMRVLNHPALVLPTHWDNFSVPYDFPQDERINQLKSFTREIIEASPKTKVIIPKYFEPITLK